MYFEVLMFKLQDLSNLPVGVRTVASRSVTLVSLYSLSCVCVAMATDAQAARKAEREGKRKEVSCHLPASGSS